MSNDRVNRVQFRGKAYQASLRHTPGGKAVGEARMSLSRNRAKKGEPADWESAWFDVTAWETAGEILGEVPDKTDITVTGRLDVAKGYKKRDGTVVEPSLKITADEVVVHDAPAQRGWESSDPESVPF